VWPLNVGQVYTTLQRLERDGLVESDGGEGERQRWYRIASAGGRELADWLRTPPELVRPPMVSADDVGTIAAKLLATERFDEPRVREVLGPAITRWAQPPRSSGPRSASPTSSTCSCPTTRRAPRWSTTVFRRASPTPSCRPHEASTRVRPGSTDRVRPRTPRRRHSRRSRTRYSARVRVVRGGCTLVMHGTRCAQRSVGPSVPGPGVGHRSGSEE
jgi:Transcriptional regulator PadR-like family